MQLTEDQKGSVRQWALEGASLGDIQKRLTEEFAINLSYMETRFLISDLDVSLKGKEKPVEPVAAPASLNPDGGGDAGGGVSVTVDSVAIPGTMISGKATFSDGETATWTIDQMGQLGLDAGTPGYRPSKEDLESFQVELSKAAEKAGF